jgi:hypothetical protein
MRLCRFTASFSATPWVEIADEASQDDRAQVSLAADAAAYAAEVRDALTGEVKRIPKVAKLPISCELAEGQIRKALARCEAERNLTNFLPLIVGDAKIRLTLALHCTQVGMGKQDGLFGKDADFIAWAIHRAMPAAQLMGHPLDALPRCLRRST